MASKQCAAESCDRPSRTRGWCPMHYQRWQKWGDPERRVLILGDDAARFWAKVDKTDTCWLWTGTTVNGYGQMRVADRKVYTHRFGYELLIGPIPEGLQIDHLCRVRHCVNPAHLEPVTAQENSLRSNNLAAANSRKTHCPRGHSYDLVSGGKRRCTVCEAKRRRDLRTSGVVQRRAMSKVRALSARGWT